jgi:hypothetical protein
MVAKKTWSILAGASTFLALVLFFRQQTTTAIESSTRILPTIKDSTHIEASKPPIQGGNDVLTVTYSTPRTAWDAFVDGTIVNTGPVTIRACTPGQPRARALFASDLMQAEAIKKVNVVISNSTGGAPRSCIVGPYDRDFDHMVARLRDVNGPGFAYVRYADGELGVGQGTKIGNAEWSFSGDPSESTQLQMDLQQSLRGHFGQEFYYGFASPADGAHGLRWFLQHTEQACGYISYANIWVNSHFPRTRLLLTELTEKLYYKKVVLVVNKESVEKIQATKDWAADYMPLPDNMPGSWSNATFRADILDRAAALANKYEGYLFIVSGGPPGKVIAAHMWDTNCRNKYVDFGSSVDPIFRDKLTRGYQQEGHPHSRQVDPMWHVPTKDVDAMPSQYGP